MQATEVKRLTINRFAASTLAIVILAAATVGLILVREPNSRNELSAGISAAPVFQAHEMLTFEQNTQLPTGGAADEAGATTSDPVQLRLRDAVSRPIYETIYFEQNTMLPARLRRNNPYFPILRLCAANVPSNSEGGVS